MGKFKKLYFYFIVVFSLFIYADNVNAYSYNYYEPTVTFKGSILTTQNFYIADSAKNNNFLMDNKIPFEDASIVPSYGLIGICTTGIINNISTTTNEINNLQFYKTQQPCNLNNTPNYIGKITYITYSIVQAGCSVQGTNCLLDASIGAYWNEGGYVQLLNAYFSNDPFIYDSSLDVIINNNNIINNSINDANNKLNDINSSINDSSSPDLDALKNTAGWLPAGPIDSILNLPLTLLNSLTTNLSKSCTPVELPLPYIDKTLTLPCLSTIYTQIEGLSVWINSIGVIASAFILFQYLMNLYKWVDDTLSFRENNFIDNWTGV